jgi:hypothetical protein
MISRSALKRYAILGSGWAFVLLGIAGLVLPFLQGVLFLVVGLYLLSLESRWARRIRLRLQRRYPLLARMSDEATDWLRRLRRRYFGP